MSATDDASLRRHLRPLPLWLRVVTAAGAAAAATAAVLLIVRFETPASGLRTSTGFRAAPRLTPTSAVAAVERTLAAGETHRYRVHASAGDALHLVVDQRGAAVKALLADPAGRPLFDAAGASRNRGTFELHEVATASGEYLLTLTGGAESAGGYRLRLDPPRPASARDRLLAAAQRLLAKGDHHRLETRFAAATAAYEQAAELANRAGDAELAAISRFRRGGAQAEMRLYQETLLDYRMVLPPWSGRVEGAALLNAMGRCYRDLGMLEEAAAAYRQAAATSERLGDGLEHAAALDNLALVLMDRGEFQPALELFTQALRELRRLHDRGEEATVLCNIGEIHVDLGAWQEAVDACRQALTIERQAGNRHVKLVAERNLSAAYLGWKRWPAAQAELESLIRLARQAGDRRDELNAENGLAYVHLMRGETAQAAAAAREALRLARVAGRQEGEANALGNLGAAQGRSGATEQALASFARALAIYRRLDQPASQASILFGRSEALDLAGRLDEARAAIEESLALIERLRTQAGPSALRASFFGARQDYYQLYLRVLMRLDRLRPGKGHDARAFAASEMTRARTMLEGLAAARLDLAADAPPILLAREATARRLLAIAQAERDRDAVDSGAAAAERLPQIDAEVRRLRSKLDQIQAEMRFRDRRFRILNETRPLTLQQIQRRVLDGGTLLLAYSLGAQESYVWAIDRGTLHAHRLAGRETIERAATAAYRALAASAGAAGRAEASRRVADLSELVLAPVAREIAGKRLLIVADGALLYVPFAALPEPRTAREPASQRVRPPLEAIEADAPPLIAAHEIVYLPSASVADLLRREVAGRPPAPKQLAVIADPVFRSDDARVEHRGRRAVVEDGGGAAASSGTRAGAPAGAGQPDPGAPDAERSARDVGLDHLSRLPFSRLEADAILGMVPAELSLRATDFAASRDLAVSPELGRYRILHFATHGFLDAIQPELSGLVLSLVDSHGQPRDGFLHAYDIYGLRLPADLVVLSACRTALGAEVRGEGLMGLTRGFMTAGAPRVVVSLWNISDHATADLMARFYHALLRQHLPPAAALRAAQLAMRERWPSPAHWAAFELQGDWR
jgi:CHAT domain-containing protein